MTIWAIADLHLSFDTPNKSMERFGENWKGWTEKISTHWHKLISSADLILIPGDISWAMTLEHALADLKWIDALPGTKVILRGNHDYWWSSLSKIEKVLPSSLHLIQNNAFHWQGIGIAGARLWDTNEYQFSDLIALDDSQSISPTHQTDEKEANEAIYQRELMRLEMSLKCLKEEASLRIAMTHYPPIGTDLKPSRASVLLEKYGIKKCLFGHLHSLKAGVQAFGKRDEIDYQLTSCDWLNFIPKKVFVTHN